jgi:hypothetical protein
LCNWIEFIQGDTDRWRAIGATVKPYDAYRIVETLISMQIRFLRQNKTVKILPPQYFFNTERPKNSLMYLYKKFATQEFLRLQGKNLREKDLVNIESVVTRARKTAQQLVDNIQTGYLRDVDAINAQIKLYQTGIEKQCQLLGAWKSKDGILAGFDAIVSQVWHNGKPIEPTDKPVYKVERKDPMVLRANILENLRVYYAALRHTPENYSSAEIADIKLEVLRLGKMAQTMGLMEDKPALKEFVESCGV